MTSQEVLRVAIFREGDFWLAQGLERDIGVQGHDLNDLMARWNMALAAELDSGDFSQLGPAPLYFQVLWDLLCGAFIPTANNRSLRIDMPIQQFGLVA